jgi:hypothetical protein
VAIRYANLKGSRIPASRRLLGVILVTGLGAAVAAHAAGVAFPLLATLPVGETIQYHVKEQTNAPAGVNGGATMASNIKFRDDVLTFSRTSATALDVKVNGGRTETVTFGTSGSLVVPSDLKQTLKPFTQVAAVLREAPSKLTASSAWSGSLTVPVGDSSVQVPLSAAVTQVAGDVRRIHATGQTKAQHARAVSKLDADVTVDETIVLLQGALQFAQGSVIVNTHRPVLGSSELGDQWTLKAVGS